MCLLLFYFQNQNYVLSSFIGFNCYWFLVVIIGMLVNILKHRPSLWLNARLTSLPLTRNLHLSPPQDTIKKAVIFDLGGVIAPSPFPIAHKWEELNGFKNGSIFSAVKFTGANGVWAKLERGELTVEEFYEPFAEEINALAIHGKDRHFTVTPEVIQDFMDNMRTGLNQSNPDVEDAIGKLKEAGLKVAILTNSWKSKNMERSLFSDHELGVLDKFYDDRRGLVDHVAESCVVGIRKPDKEIYQKTLEHLGVDAEDAVYLDDIGGYLKPAKELGMSIIKVNRINEALVELQSMVGVDLGVVPGTRRVAEGMEIDKDKLRQYLIDTMNLYIYEDLVVRQFSYSLSNPTYLIKIDDVKYVLRKKPSGKLHPGTHDIEKEFKILNILDREGVPVPKVLVLCEDSSVIGTPFYLMEYVDGIIYKDPSLPGLTPEERTKVYGAMNRTLAQIHSIDINKADFDVIDKDDGYIARQIKILSKQYKDTKTVESDTMNNVIKWLSDNIPELTPFNVSVVHGDYLLSNLIFDAEDPGKVKAVIDWEFSGLGDSLIDAASGCVAHYIPPTFSLVPGLLGKDLKRLGIPTDQEYMMHYCYNMGINKMKSWNYYLSFAFFRIAAMLQDVHKRSLQDPTNVNESKEIGEAIEVFASISWEFAQKHQVSDQNADSMYTSSSVNGGMFPHVRQLHTSVQTCGGIPNIIHVPPTNDQLVIHPDSLGTKAKLLHEAVTEFVNDEIVPLEQELRKHLLSEDFKPAGKVELFIPAEHMISEDYENDYEPSEKIELLKQKAKTCGLWNLFVLDGLDPSGESGQNLSNLEYAHICEVMGMSPFAPEVFNCSAPDTANMEVLMRFGSKEQKETWLTPLLEGNIRSSFAMTESSGAFSDDSQLESSIVRDGDEYVINTKLCWSSGARDPRNKICIFIGKTDPKADKMNQHTVFLIPMESPGISVLKPPTVYPFKESPIAQGEVDFTDVRVPASNILLGEGRGSEIAHGRLGPGRIHHCMRLIGSAERILQLMVDKVDRKSQEDQGPMLQDIALSRIELDQARLLTLKAALMMDTGGLEMAAQDVLMIKVVVPKMCMSVLDRAEQVLGGGDVDSDLLLRQLCSWTRALRLSDGSDHLQLRMIAKREFEK